MKILKECFLKFTSAIFHKAKNQNFVNTVCCGVRGRALPHTPMSAGSNPSAAVDCLP